MIGWVGWMAACTGQPARAPLPLPAPLTDTAPSPELPPDLPANVLVILVDDFGTDKFGAYAEHPEAPPTPNLDALAAEGVLFRNAWAYPSCSASRAALLTGRYGRRTGVGDVVYWSTSYALPSRELTLAEVLPQTWATSLVGKWHLAGYDAPEAVISPGTQGFDWYAVALGNLGDSSQPATQTGYYRWEEIVNGKSTWQDTYATTVQVDHALSRLSEMPSPWFMLVSLNAPHIPLDLPPKGLYDGPVDPRVQPDSYAAVVQAMDAELGRMLAEVDLTDTLVLFAADNGTTSVAITPPRDPDQGKLTMFEGGVNVPLIAAGPGVARGGESAALVHVVDLFATVAEAAGVSIAGLMDENKEPIAIDSQSLLPYAADPSAPGRAVVYTERFLPLGVTPPYTIDQRAVRDERFKLVSNELTGVETLYDLADRLDDGPELLTAGPLTPDAAAAYATLRVALADFRSELAAATPPRTP